MINRSDKFKLSIVLFLFLTIITIIIASCGPMSKELRMYEGTPLSADKICIVWTESADRGGIKIIKIDGKSVYISPFDTVELLPGNHVIEIFLDGLFHIYHDTEKLRSYTPISLDVTCEAEHAYLIGYVINYWVGGKISYYPFVSDVTYDSNIHNVRNSLEYRRQVMETTLHKRKDPVSKRKEPGHPLMREGL
jgi:hypothetical protein